MRVWTENQTKQTAHCATEGDAAVTGNKASKKFAWNFQSRRAWIYYWWSFINNQTSNMIRPWWSAERSITSGNHVIFLKAPVSNQRDIRRYAVTNLHSTSTGSTWDPLHLDDLSRPPPQKVYAYNRERNTYTHSHFLSHTRGHAQQTPKHTHHVVSCLVRSSRKPTLVALSF